MRKTSGCKSIPRRYGRFVLPPRDPSVPPPCIPVRAPPGARLRLSRRRVNAKMLWAWLVFGFVVLPVAILVPARLGGGHDLTYRLIVSLWFALMSGIIFGAAIFIFKLDKKT
jgi:hypothetical protein